MKFIVGVQITLDGIVTPTISLEGDKSKKEDGEKIILS